MTFCLRRYTVRLREARRVIHCVSNATVIEYDHRYQIAIKLRPYIIQEALPNVNRSKYINKASILLGWRRI